MLYKQENTAQVQHEEIHEKTKESPAETNTKENKQFTRKHRYMLRHITNTNNDNI